MIRSAFFTVGMFMLLWGVTFLIVDRMLVQLDSFVLEKSPVLDLFTTIDENNVLVLSPPDWAVFGLLTIGSLTMLYSIALPKKQG